ncbi:MAG: peptidylprolyl isomerase [Steroidobacteraceae bacterium]
MSFIFKSLTASALLLAGVLVHAQATAPETRGVLLDRIVAVVNDGIVLGSDLEQQMRVISDRIEQQGQQLPPRNILRQQVLERLVLQELQMQRAERLGIQVSDEALNQALTDVASRNGIQFSDLPAALEEQGLDYRSYRDDVRREMTLAQLRQRDVYSRIYLSPREVEQCVATRKASPDTDRDFNIAHILVSVPSSATSEQIAERTARAEGITERARRGEDFAQLAVTYSDAGTALEGGQLGWRKAGQLPSFVAETIPTMQAGEVTEPIRTPSGLHIFKLLESRGAQQASLVSQTHARHILLRTNAIEDDETVRQKLTEIRARIVGGESFETIASVTSADPGSAANGGDLGWVGPGTFVPEFERQLDTLGENEISEPFKTQYGWHIVQLLGRRTYDATDDVLRNRCAAQLREARADEETEIWLRRLRDDAFVELRM